MATSVVFMAVISSFPIFSVFKYNKSYEEAIPLSCMGIVLILFGFGMAGNLLLGVYAVLLLAVVFYLLIGVEIFNNRQCLKPFISLKLKKLFTPGFVVFMLLSVFFHYIHYGRVALFVDDFSHWVYVVKAMFHIDDFGTNPVSNVIFYDYPPAMALFQYAMQKIGHIICGMPSFSEWMVYIAYDILLMAVMMPVYKNVSWKQPSKYICLTAVILLIPAAFLYLICNSAAIDPFLSVITAAITVAIMLKDNTGRFYHAYIYMALVTLLLTKSPGLLFAVALMVMYITDCILLEIKESGCGFIKALIKSKWNIILSFCAVAVPKLLWNIKVNMNGSPKVNSRPIDFAILWEIIKGTDTSYRTAVMESYIRKLFHTPIYYILFAAPFVIVAFSLFILYRKKLTNGQKITYIVCPVVYTIIYLVGMGLMYMFKFEEYEAVILAAFGRYLHILFMIFFIVAFVVLCKTADVMPRFLSVAVNIGIIVVSLCAPVFCHSSQDVLALLDRSSCDNSNEVRSPYNIIADKTMEVCEEPSNVFFVTQEGTGYDYFVFKTVVYPNIINNDWGKIHIGPPRDEEEIPSTEITAQQWQEELKQQYDYVALYKLNDEFYENYSVVFDNPDDIAENCVYKVNKDNGLLYLVK